MRTTAGIVIEKKAIEQMSLRDLLSYADLIKEELFKWMEEHRATFFGPVKLACEIHIKRFEDEALRVVEEICQRHGNVTSFQRRRCG